MKRLSLVLTSAAVVLLSSACLPALPSIGFNEPADVDDFLGTWKIKKTSGMKILGQSLLQYTFTDDCDWEDDTGSFGYEGCDVETLPGVTFEYDFLLHEP